MWYFAQTTDYTFDTDLEPYSTGSAAGGTAWLIIYLAYIVLMYAGLWKMFEKAKVEGWKGIIPIYNYVIMWRLIGLSGWYTLLLFIPIVNIVALIYLCYKLAQAYGSGIGMTILLLLSVGFIILGFGKAKYVGPAKSAEA